MQVSSLMLNATFGSFPRPRHKIRYGLGTTFPLARCRWVAVEVGNREDKYGSMRPALKPFTETAVRGGLADPARHQHRASGTLRIWEGSEESRAFLPPRSRQNRNQE